MNDGGLLLEEEKEFRRFYRLSLWWVTHRALLVRIGYGLLIALDAGLLLFAIWHLADAFAFSYEREQRTVYEMVARGQTDLNAYTRGNAAGDLELSEARVLSIGSGRYDLYATVLNPNNDWWAEFEYVFGSGGEEIARGTGFVLPGEKKPVVSLALEAEKPFSIAEFSIVGVKWHRVDHHVVSDYQIWSQDRLDLVVEGARFTTDMKLDGETFGRFSFSVTNKTAFSYYDPVFYLILKRGSSVVGVSRTTLQELESEEEAVVNVNWFGTLPSVSDVEVIPEVNIFDLDVYKPLEGEMTVDTRTRVFR
jgi:hypothetical protein